MTWKLFCQLLILMAFATTCAVVIAGAFRYPRGKK